MKKEIVLLQNEMKKHGITMYLVPTGDEHQSEYVPEYYKFREYLSGFTGSAGSLLVTNEEALLWTDGRYFVQAEKELENSGIILMKSGEKGVPTMAEYISLKIECGNILGFHGALFSYEQSMYLIGCVKGKGALVLDIDLACKVWNNSPAMDCSKIKRLESCYTGCSVQEKLKQIREKMKQRNTDIHVVSSLDDIAWIFNLRGNDIPYNPVFYSYAVITMEQTILFVKPFTVSDDLTEWLKQEQIELRDYIDFFDYLKNEICSRKVLLDKMRSSYKTCSILMEKNELFFEENPSVLLNSVKNEVECANLTAAHETDGLVMCRFIYWIKKKIKEGAAVTEWEAAEYLDKMRLEAEGCLDLSFDTIAAYGSNAAMCHYAPSRENPVYLKPEGFFLVDAGGQYLKGTTDVTRTIVLGELSQEQKLHYTLVLQGNIRLAMAHFPEGICGANLDILARGPLWQYGLDFNHGTGHGVGYCLNVHEGPNNIHWNLQRKNAKTVPFKPGMLTSDEPGLYLEGKYGIRLENLLLTKKSEKTEGFLAFDTVTKVVFDREAILPKLLSEEEKNWLNAYHQNVYELYAEKMTSEEAAWLKSAAEAL